MVQLDLTPNLLDCCHLEMPPNEKQMADAMTNLRSSKRRIDEISVAAPSIAGIEGGDALVAQLELQAIDEFEQANALVPGALPVPDFSGLYKRARNARASGDDENQGRVCAQDYYHLSRC